MSKKNLFIHISKSNDQKNIVFGLLLFFVVFLMINPVTGYAAEKSSNHLAVRVNLQGNMVTVADFTINDLEAMKQTRQVYSSIDPMPAPSITLAQGVMLSELLLEANINVDSVQSITLSSSDGWSHTYKKELFSESNRYYFPDIVKGWDSASAHPPEFLPGTEDNKNPVKPLLALKTFQERFNTSIDWSKISDSEGIKFCFGQANIEEQSMVYYGKYINKIDVVIDGASPFISLDSSVNGQYFKPGSTVTLSGTVQGIKSVSISVADPNNKALVSKENIDTSQGTYLFNLPIASNAPQGKYRVSISQNEKPNYQSQFMIYVSKTGAPDQDSTNTGQNSDPDPDTGKSTRAGGSSSGVQGNPADSLTVMVGYYGGPYMTKKVFTLEDLQQMSQVKQAYTFIDNMPAVVIDSAIGVKLTDILESSGIDVNSIEAFYFFCSDVTSSWYETLTKSYLLDTNRYYYPNLQNDWDSDTGSAGPEAKAGAVEVDTIIAYEDNWQRFATEPDFTNMDTSTRFRLLFGQTDTVTHTASRSAKWIHAIEVMLGGTPPSGVTLDKTALNLEVGSTFKLTPSIGIVDETTDKRLKWSSSNPDIVKVDSSGRVKVLAQGSAVITVATVVGDKTAICVINRPEEADQSKPGSEHPASVPDSNTNGESPSQQTSTKAFTETEVKNKTDPREQHLTDKKEGMTAEIDADAGVQPWRVYEMSPNAVALPNIKNKNILTPYTGVGAIVLFLLGVLIRLKKYTSEV